MEKRRFTRTHSIYYLKIFKHEDGSLLGQLVDISEGGVMLICEEKQPVGDRFKVSMIFPEDTEGETKEVEFELECRWCQKDFNPSFYAAGFKFVDPDEALLGSIHELVDAYSFKE
jgi:c-di-GMP-binding flagellar brake protein YcgR